MFDRPHARMQLPQLKRSFFMLLKDGVIDSEWAALAQPLKYITVEID